jgi:SAM-dependent methyltransferase
MADIRVTRIDRCCLCDISGVVAYATVTDRLFLIPGKWTLLRCPQCGLLWLANRPIPEDVPRLYEHYYTHQDATPDSFFRQLVKTGIPAAWMGYHHGNLAMVSLGWLLGLIGPVREVAARCVMWLERTDGQRVFDFGCGSGRLLLDLQALGWEVAGSDIDPQAVASARRALNSSRVYLYGAEESLNEDATFDAFVSSHVIEHMADPDIVFLDARRRLRAGGKLVVVTPNSQSLGHRIFGQHWFGLHPPHHFVIYNARSLRRIAERNGFANCRVVSSSAPAYFVWLGGDLLRTLGHVPGARTYARTPLVALKGLAFWLRESIQCRWGSDGGEELVLRATRQ